MSPPSFESHRRACYFKGQLISKGLFGMYPQFFQKTNEKIRLNFYDTSGRLVFVRFLEGFEDTPKTFRNYVTFNKENRQGLYGCTVIFFSLRTY
jgi:hypothetical protein